ncbi:MAG: T9SS type A sorting domain-containing protein [Ignavibacteriales bacterium]|nr:T9SS type A sorting domain-containing protein [Ignavibacteriales bacterium]
MKKILMAFISMFLIASIAFGTGKKERMDVFGEKTKMSVAMVDAPSSPWFPMQQALQSQLISMRTVEYSPTNSNVIWMSGYAGTGTKPDLVFRTTDGGDNWSQYTLPTGSIGASNLVVKNDTVAVIGTFAGYILRTQNGGAKWDTVFSYSANDLGWVDGVSYVGTTRDTMIAIGDADANGAMVARSTDAGKTWTRATGLPTALQEAAGWASYATYGAATASYGKTVWTTWYYGSSKNPIILKSIDGGATWTGIECALPGGMASNYYFRSIYMKDDNLGFAVGRRATGTTTDFDNCLMKTTNGGTTWDTLSVEKGIAQKEQKVYTARPIPGTNSIMAVGFSTVTGSKSWLSTDNGTTWTKLNTPGTSNVTQSAFVSATKGWAVGYISILKYSPTVEVTFIANTAGIPDTLKTTSTVQMRGSTSVLTWDNNSVKMTNIGGDYWRAKARFEPGTALDFKFFTNVKSAITSSDNGWEADAATGNRKLVVGNNDSTLAVEYANGFKSGAAQFGGPFTQKPDSFYVCYIRVNMQGYVGWDPAKMVVGARGSFASSGWGLTIPGTQEANHANGGQTTYDGTQFYNLAVYWPKKLIDTAKSDGDKTMSYKWVIHSKGSPLNEDWSKMVANPNTQQTFVMPKQDTTIQWIWFDNKAPIIGTGTDTVTVIFATDLSKAIATNSLKPGDSVSVRFGFNGSASSVKTDILKKRGLSGSVYVDTAKVIGVQVDTSKAGFYYQYYLTKNGTEYREVFYDYFYTGTDNSLAEKRKMKITGKNITLTVFDTSKNTTSINRQPVWQSTQKLARNVNVTFTCDLRPAYYHLFNSDSLFDVQTAFRNMGKGDADSVYKWGVWMNGPAVGGWGNPTGSDWGGPLRLNLLKKMYDDGTHGDAKSGDRIYTLKQMFYKDSSNNTVGQVFKFGIYGGDNEGGQGGYGNNHVENITDADSIYTIASDFGSINPKYFRAWNYDLHKPVFVGVQQLSAVPLVFALDQNYPNPFNPTTTINYSIPTASKVALSVFNVLGQEVAKLVNENQTAGKYQVSFDASRFSSGVYLYRVDAGSFTAVKKILLVK